MDEAAVDSLLSLTSVDGDGMAPASASVEGEASCAVEATGVDSC